MSSLAFKQAFIDALYRRDGPRPHVRGESYVVRCPYCGDSHDLRKAHFYITIHMDEESPILYNCFKCPVGGVMNREVMETLGLSDSSLMDGISYLNRNAVHYDKKEINEETKVLTFDYQLPDIQEGPKLDYIRKRLGIPFTKKDFEKMKVITSFRNFLKLNNIKKLTCQNRVAYLYENYFVGFLSHGNGYILFRDITGQSEIPWIKYPITNKAREGKVFYTLSAEIDLLTTETITVNLAEGVFDILGVYYHFLKHQKNSINIAVTGKYYETIFYYIIGLGLIGSNVVVNIFADNDKEFNTKYHQKQEGDTTLEYYQKLLVNIKHLFKSVYVYYNEIGKDMGVPKDKISLLKYKL